jgi:phosphoglycolate phosphatase-like HAD superfamily hydrolase
LRADASPLTVAPLRAVLFDLDGTVLDTAPDMWNAMNRLLGEQGRALLPYAAIRPFVSHGARGVLLQGFGDVDADRISRNCKIAFSRSIAPT